MPCKHLIVSGKVQGVFFRASARRQAEEYGINGWVRNAPGGQVEIVAEGSHENLEQFIAWCREGPLKAKVDSIRIENVPEQNFKEFSILR